jgi:hypothetical protein
LVVLELHDSADFQQLQHLTPAGVSELGYPTTITSADGNARMDFND